MTDAKTKPTAKIPATVGAAIDLLYATREARRRLDAEAKTLREKETAIEDAIFYRFAKQDLDGGRGKLAQASISRLDVPTLEDDVKFFAHLKKHPEDLDLLQRRLSSEAVRARWAEKKVVPGVGVFTRVSLSLSKRK